jgi:acetyl-CoA carboxylase biotin carboxyl carrier protein
MSDLSADDVREILRLVEASDFEEFELETPRFSIRFRRGAAPEPEHSEAPAPSNSLLQSPNGLVEVRAPIVGTFYRAPSPGAPPFVDVGAMVEADTQVCIVEVMKLMNSVVAGVAGTVEQVCCNDAEPVEYGDVLFRIRPA